MSTCVPAESRVGTGAGETRHSRVGARAAWCVREDGVQGWVKTGWAVLLGLALLACGGAPPAPGEGPGGRVADSAGAARSGAMVTARAEATGIETTVFSDAAGRFAFGALDGGRYRLTAKTPAARAASIELVLPDDVSEPLTFTLEPDPDYARSVPSAAWLALLPDGARKREFVLNCGSCHEIGHDRIMRGDAPRSAEDWSAAIALMRAIDVYGLTPPDFDDAAYAAWLAEHLDAEAVASLRPAAPARGEALRARFTEYPVPKTPSLPHDLVLGPRGRVWITAFYQNVLWALDPADGGVETFPVNEQPEVMGQVRALAFDGDGALWTLLGGTESVVRLDTASGALRSFPVGMYPHSIELDSAGRIWFNDYLSPRKRIGRLDPAAGGVEVYEIPGVALGAGEGLPLLYGLQVDRHDVVWGTMLAANKLFRFDPASGETELFDMPADNSGPRRPGLGPDGALWIPEFNTGTLARFDPATKTFTRHPLGADTLGPYDVAVDPRRGHVWAAAALGSALVRFDPATGRVDTFPFPTEPAYPRHLAIDPESGDVWTTYSSMPDATPKIVRLELQAGAHSLAATPTAK